MQPRVKPRAYELMPEILAFIQREGATTQTAVTQRALHIIERLGYVNRPAAINWSLTMLRWKNLASNPKRGTWAVADAGRDVTLTESECVAITKEYEAHKKRMKAR
jgi:restriction endonuclease Mrr